jgi:Holliday junction resolvasome RuvABC ATP-dependent DNA helicase subunit
MNKYIFTKPVKDNQTGTFRIVDGNGKDLTDMFPSVRQLMMELAFDNDQCLKIDTETGRCYRKGIELFDGDTSAIAEVTPVTPAAPEVVDPVLSFIHTEAVKIRPETLVMTDLKWKYLVRSALRGKNIMMTGPAGTGKTLAAQTLQKALNRPFFYFNLGATQDPRGTLIGNTHFKKDTGTTFAESVFVKAIQTKDAIVLLDELSRAHPEAWNILMTVLDPGQKYLRLDEHQDAPTIPVAEGVTFIATANIGNEYTATRAMDRALVDRFIIVEMDVLNKDQEKSLLKRVHPSLSDAAANAIADIASITRTEMSSDNPKISTAVSTRISVEMGGLLADGFSLAEAAEVCIYPFYDRSGGLDSERTYIKQLVQKYDIKSGVGATAATAGGRSGSNLPF